MSSKWIIDKHSDTLNKKFTDAFSKKVLKGRAPMPVDISPRTYPYIDLVMMYTAGVSAAMEIVTEEQERDR